MFRALWLAAMAANVGFWMQNVGAVWLMGTQTDSALLVSLVQTAMSLPIVFMALPAGAMADVLDLRRMLLGTQAWMLGAATVLAALTLIDRSPPWVLLALTFLLGLGRAANAPAWQAAIPEVVEPSQLPSAVALNSVQFNVGRAVGPAIGGLIVAAAGPEAVFAINSVSLLGVVLVLLRWRRQPEDTVSAGERIFSAVGAGLRYLRNAPALQAVLIRTALFIVPASALWALLPVVARSRLGMNASGFGALLACLGAGAVLGVAVLPRIRERLHLDLRLVAGCGLFTLALVVLAMVGNGVVVGVAMVGGGVAWTGVLTNLNVATRAKEAEGPRACICPPLGT